MSMNLTLQVNAEDKASQVLSNIQQKISKAQDTIVKGNQKIIESTKRLNANILSAASSFAAFGAGATALYTSFSNLEKAQLRVASAQKEVTSAQATALQAQLSYQRAVERYGEASEQAKQALLRLKAAQEQLRIAQERVALAQNDLSDTYANFIANLAPQVISLTIGIQGAFKALGITSISQLVPSIRAVGVALRSAFITNPVGIAIVAIGSAVALLATNTFGLRDRIVELGDTILAFIDKHLKPLADAIRFVIDALKPVADLFGSIFINDLDESSKAIDNLKAISIQSFTDIGDKAIEFKGINEEVFASIEASIEEFNDIVSKSMEGVSIDINSANDSISNSISNSIQSFNSFSNSIDYTTSKIDNFADVAKASMDEVSNTIASKAKVIIASNLEVASSIEELSRALAKGVPASIFNKPRASGVVEINDGFITPGGTIVRGRLDENTYVLKKEVVEGIRKGIINKVTFEDYIPAKHGFEGLVTKPTLFLAGEAGEEYVKITPNNNTSNTLRLVVEFVDSEGRTLGSETLDLANKEATLRLKAKGVRLL